MKTPEKYKVWDISGIKIDFLKTTFKLKLFITFFFWRIADIPNLNSLPNTFNLYTDVEKQKQVVFMIYFFFLSTNANIYKVCVMLNSHVLVSVSSLLSWLIYFQGFLLLHVDYTDVDGQITHLITGVYRNVNSFLLCANICC